MVVKEVYEKGERKERKTEFVVGHIPESLSEVLTPLIDSFKYSILLQLLMLKIATADFAFSHFTDFRHKSASNARNSCKKAKGRR